MRKAQKQQIEDLIALLFEAHQEIKYTIENGNTDLALDLLAQCQQSAIAAENMICALEGEEHKTISHLESYCDTLFQVYEAVQNGQALNNVNEWLREDWDAIQRSVQEDITARKEVVFLPYNASMWDSLESVWKAADEDPSCDAYVVPIPYYDKDADEKFVEFHYEGDQYPSYVPITDYRTYDLAKRKPDIVFIHNPYDANNYATSIHPAIYSKNLKKHTGKLVYIPYFVMSEMKLEQVIDEVEKKMTHFCIQPGVLNADKVIVQSEEMKRIYVEVLTKYAGEHTRSRWEEKVLGLGSPKFDKVNNTGAEDFEIPEGWKPVLYKEDGSRRKTILYNTSIATFLQYKGAVFFKMRSVFRTFYENRDEVALLWRPHPLMKTTIESMEPKLCTEYEKLVNEYREASWGIYDDTPDLNRAIELADAYYGDTSSLVQLCREKGMPVTIQDVDSENVEELNQWERWLQAAQFPVGFKYMTKKDNYLYGFVVEGNALLRINLNSGVVNHVASLPKEKMNEEAFCFAPGCYKDIIYFGLDGSNGTYVYDEAEERFVLIDSNGWRVVHRSGRYLYNIFFEEKRFMCLDLEKKSVLWIKDLRPAAVQQEKEPDTLLFVTDIYEYQDAFYAATYQTGYILQISFTGEYTCYKISDADGFKGLCGIGEDIYLLSRNAEIIQWNVKKKQEVQRYGEFFDNQKYRVERLEGCFRWDNTIYFLGRGLGSWVEEMMYRRDFGVSFNIATKQIKVFTYNEEFGMEQELDKTYAFVASDEEGKLYFLSAFGKLYQYDMETKKGYSLEVQYPEGLRIENLLQEEQAEEKVIGEKVYSLISLL